MSPSEQENLASHSSEKNSIIALVDSLKEQKTKMLGNL